MAIATETRAGAGSTGGDSRRRGVLSPAGHRANRQGRFAFALMLPSLVWSAALLVYPLVVVVRNSFYHVGAGIGTAPQFVGLAQYAELLRDPAFWHSVQVTIIFTAGNLLGSFGIGLATALLLRQRFVGRPVARVIILLPWAVPQVAAVVVWRWLLQAQYGALNYVLWRLHLVASPSVEWLVRPDLGLWAVLFVTVWWQYPIATTFLLAGLEAIPTELYEAARIDGANIWQGFRYVTWPALRAVRNVLALLLLFWSLGQVIVIWAMTEGGPAAATQTLAILVYTRAFNDFRFGNAAAVATLVLLVALALGVVYYRLALRAREGD